MKFIKSLILTGVLSCTSYANAQAVNLDDLLKTIEQGQKAQTAENISREKAFIASQSEQVAKLKKVTQNRNNLLQQSSNLETQFEENEIKLGNLTGALNKRMGSLKELFGVLQQVAGDTKNKFATSNAVSYTHLTLPTIYSV